MFFTYLMDNVIYRTRSPHSLTQELILPVHLQKFCKISKYQIRSVSYKWMAKEIGLVLL